MGYRINAARIVAFEWWLSRVHLGEANTPELPNTHSTQKLANPKPRLRTSRCSRHSVLVYLSRWRHRLHGFASVLGIISILSFVSTLGDRLTNRNLNNNVTFCYERIGLGLGFCQI